MSRCAAFSLWLAMAGMAYGQAAVEAGLGASRAATSTAPARGIGKSMSGIAGGLDKALKPAQKDAEAAPAAVSATSIGSAARPAEKKEYEDAGGIEAGLGYDELVRRFGPASMAMTSGAEKALSYPGKAGMYQVTVLDGKVKSVEKPLP